MKQKCYEKLFVRILKEAKNKEKENLKDDYTNCIRIRMGVRVDDETLITFALNHSQTVEKIGANENKEGQRLLTYINEGNKDIKDDFSDFPCMGTGHEGIYALIADVMCEETGIRFQYEPGDEGCSSEYSILFAKSMLPYVFTETETIIPICLLMVFIRN